jgi:hypothetical protein
MADTYFVWFGVAGDLSLVAEQTELSIEVTQNLAYNTEYTWRVDVWDGVFLTTGDEWTFTTIAFDPPAYSVHPITGLPTGDNSIVTLRRLVLCSDNKVYYES